MYAVLHYNACAPLAGDIERIVGAIVADRFAADAARVAVPAANAKILAASGARHAALGAREVVAARAVSRVVVAHDVDALAARPDVTMEVTVAADLTAAGRDPALVHLAAALVHVGVAEWTWVGRLLEYHGSRGAIGDRCRGDYLFIRHRLRCRCRWLL